RVAVERDRPAEGRVQVLGGDRGGMQPDDLPEHRERRLARPRIADSGEIGVEIEHRGCEVNMRRRPTESVTGVSRGATRVTGRSANAAIIRARRSTPPLEPMPRSLTAFAAVAALAALGSARAHHSVAMYDTDNLTTLTGTVTRVEWTSPHVFIYFSVAGDDGGATEWAMELDPPVLLRRYGWTRDTVKVGERITCTGAPAKSGAA